MRHSILPLAAAVLCVATASCGDHPQGPDGLDLLAVPVDTTIALGSWLDAHRTDSAAFDAPAGSPDESICRAAESSVTIAGAAMRRYAVFYIPDAPAGEMFPADTAHLARRMCHLRAVWLVRQTDDSASARTYADSVESVLTARLGAGRGGAEIAGVGTGAWRHTKTWAIGDSRVVLGVERPTDYVNETSGRLSKHHGRVIVAAYAPHSGLGPTDERLETGGYTRSHFPHDGDRELRRARADSALKLSGAEPIVTGLRRVLDHARARADSDSAHTAHTAAIDSILSGAVMRTRDSLGALDAAHRAATLLATDFAIAAYAGRLYTDTASSDGALAAGATRHRLQSAGVQYLEDSHSGALVYDRARLWAAYRTDSLGAAGRLAFIELLFNAWSTKPNCTDGRNGFDRVIEHGEAALRGGQTDPLIHFYVGEAYRDIYSLAHGGGAGHVDEKDFAPRAEDARRKAIEHLTTALKTLRQPLVRHAAWDDALRLTLRVHTEPSFFCIYD